MMRASLLLALVATPALADEPAIPHFTAEAGGVTHQITGEWEYMVGGGVAAFDCSGDALPDLFLAGGASKASLWQNASAPGGALTFT